jgi:N-acetylglucosamine-6-phosphate deacetylase
VSNPSVCLRARHHASGDWVDVFCEQGTIHSITPAAGPAPPSALHAEWVAPGLFDLQINGSHGHAFSSERLTVEEVRQVVDACAQHGITGLCPTLITNSEEALSHGFRVLDQACRTDPVVARAMPGFHLEGPYLSPEDGPRGAHPRQHIRPPNLEEFQRLEEAAGGRIRLVTLAPEHDGALPFIEKLTSWGIVVALGHTGASGKRIQEAVRAGARLSTHLGNGSHALLPRHDNYIWEQLAEDGLWASLIADGQHLPAAMLRCLLRVKTPARTVLTCDASSLAGLPPGLYSEWGQELEVVASPTGSKVVVPGTPYLAGSAVFTDTCVRHIQDVAGASLEEALAMATLRPRELLGLPLCPVAAGAPADLVLFEHNPSTRFRVTATIRGGEVVPAV